MKFDCGKRSRKQKRKARNRALRLWHPWFAWHPVRIGRHNCRWLETIQRKGVEQTVYDEFGAVGTIYIWSYK